MTDCHFQPNPSDVISVKTGNGNTYNFNVATVLAYASANNLGNSFVFFGGYSYVASIYFFNSSQTIGHFGTPSYIEYSTEYADYYWGFEQNLGFTPRTRQSYNYNMKNGTISSSSSISLTFYSKTVDDVTYYISKPNWEFQNPSIIMYVGSLQTVVIDNVVPDMNRSGGAGSGYIGNSLLSNKKMVGYNVPTSSAESTKTESVNEASETPVANKPKIGNGFARIKFLRDVQWVTGEYYYEDVALSNDITKYITSEAYDGSIVSNSNEVYYAPYYHTDYIFYGGTEYRRPWSYNSVDSCFELVDVNTGDYENNPHTVWQFPIKKMRNVTKIEFDLKIVKTSYSFPNCYMLISCAKYKSENERDNVPNSSNIVTLTIARDIVPPVSYDIKVNDDNWHTYSLESNNLDYVDYIVITAIAGKYDLRIKKIYGDLRQ